MRRATRRASSAAIYSYHTTDLGRGEHRLQTPWWTGTAGCSRTIRRHHPPPEGSPHPAGSTPTPGGGHDRNFDESPATTCNFRRWANCSDGDFQWTPSHRSHRALTSAGRPYTRFPRGEHPPWATIFGHRDVGDTPVLALRTPSRPDPASIAARFNKPRNAQDLADSLRGGAIYARWQANGCMSGHSARRRRQRRPGPATPRYVTFDRGAI